jgi:endonuclease/exonuclease/phosphatase family metal-dependent hydrolase
VEPEAQAASGVERRLAAAMDARPMRLDYILLGGGARVRSCMTALEGTTVPPPSDHYGVVADICMLPGPRARL